MVIKFQEKAALTWLWVSSAIEKKARDSEAQMIAFGIFGILNYPVFYIIWSAISNQPYESIGLRLLAGALCLLLVFKNHWPQKFHKYLPAYWYLTLLICLPFFCTFMFLKNQGSEAWVLNGMLVLFLLILIVDWLSFVCLLTLGVISGYVYYQIVFGRDSISIDSKDIFGIFSSYVLATIIGMVFSRNRETLQLKKTIGSITTLGASIAHELRTPLASISDATSSIQEQLPKLIYAYKAAKKQKISVKTIPKVQLEELNDLLDDITAETKFANTVIDMLLVKVKQPDINKTEFKHHSMAACINQAIRRYPFDLEEQELVVWNNKSDFKFNGNELFVIHIFFNLLKNSLYHIKKARKGNIHIWLETGAKTNALYFKDTGSGIPAKYMPHLFTQFFTKSHRGTGLGLTFCKLVMESMGGTIICRSIEGQYTEFELKFPAIEE